MSSAFESCVTEVFEDDFREALNYIIHNEIEPEANDASGSTRNKLEKKQTVLCRRTCAAPALSWCYVSAASALFLCHTYAAIVPR